MIKKMEFYCDMHGTRQILKSDEKNGTKLH